MKSVGQSGNTTSVEYFSLLYSRPRTMHWAHAIIVVLLILVAAEVYATMQHATKAEDNSAAVIMLLTNSNGV
jgi:hypothetical protein